MRQNSNTPLKRKNYHLSFRFAYGTLDDGTIWVRPPSGHLFHVNSLTLRIILELNSGVSVDTVCKKYHLLENEVWSILGSFEKEEAIVKPKYGKIIRAKQQEDISLTPFILLVIVLGIIQADYFSLHARTFLLKYWYEGIFIGAIAVFAVFFHEIGHYFIAKKYFKPKFGFTFLFIFPAVYVDTHSAWTLPRNIRLLINASGCIADMIVNTAAIALVIGNPRLEYFVTPFLLMQYTRWSIVLNPLFSGDGYWLLADFFGVVNLTKKGFQNLIRLKLNLYSLFGLMSVLMMISSIMGIIWFIFNTLWKLFFPS